MTFNNYCLTSAIHFLGIFFPITITKILTSTKDVVNQWEELGLNLGLSCSQLKSIDADNAQIQSKKRAMIAEWMGSSQACWCLLVKALQCIEMNVAAAEIQRTRGNY